MWSYRMIYIFLCISFLCQNLLADSSNKNMSLEHLGKLKNLLQKDLTARLTQSHIMSGKEEKGYFHWNSKKKCVRIEMDDGTVYLYNEGGLHIKEVEKDWVYTPLPGDWFSVFSNPEKILEKQKHPVKEIEKKTYALHLEENHHFVQVFWTDESLKGWLQGSMNSGQPMNEVGITLEPQKTIKLADYLWKPGTSFSVGR